MHAATDSTRSSLRLSPIQRSRTSAFSPSFWVGPLITCSQAVYKLTLFTHQGANDSRLPDTPGGPQQNVPLDAFTANLHAILSHKHIAGRPDLRIILITPPPVDERMLRATDSANIPGFNGLRRTADTTAKYAEAVRQVGKDRGVQVCDVWSAMMREAGWDESSTAPLPGSESADENAVLRRFFSDGNMNTCHNESPAD